jgi:hypothetical protein
MAAIVARLFCDLYDAPVKEPAQGRVPQQRPMNRRDELHCGIATPDVRALVRQYGIDPCGVPLTPVRRKHDCGTRDPQRHRCSNVFRFANLNSIDRTIGCTAFAQQPDTHGYTYTQSQHKHQGANDVYQQSRASPVNAPEYASVALFHTGVRVNTCRRGCCRTILKPGGYFKTGCHRRREGNARQRCGRAAELQASRPVLLSRPPSGSMGPLLATPEAIAPHSGSEPRNVTPIPPESLR